MKRWRVLFADRMLQFLPQLRNRYFFAIDLAAFCIAPVAAAWIRTDGVLGQNGVDSLIRLFGALALYILISSLVRWPIFYGLGLYSRYWRYASIDELGQIILAVLTSSVLLLLIFFGVLRPFLVIFEDFPRSVPLLDGVFVLLAVGGSRFSVRLVEQFIKRMQPRPAGPIMRVVIFGAGSSGTMIVKEMQSNPQLGLEPVVFLDADRNKQGAIIQGIPVVGDRADLAKVIERYGIQQAIIAMPTASGKAIREITQLCQQLNLPVKTVPGVFELLDGSVTVNQLRPVDLSDLLRREPVVIDAVDVAQMLRGKQVLVTGAGGSIGSELCRQIARCQPSSMVLLGHGENSVFEIANEQRRLTPSLRIHSVIADIRDLTRLKSVFSAFEPEVVFHAAAHKHVPLMEENIEEAVTNNVLGTRNVLDACVAHRVARFVLISTDKAVNPTSVMGATKRTAELLLQDVVARTGSAYMAVRFGNVLGSRGSVVPFFKQQIAQGGPITITHPDVRRYFMTIPEAVQLVLQAATLGKGGEIFVLDMGEPIKIVDMARELIRLSGLEEGRDIDIVYTGLRPGEKLFEELFLGSEDYLRTKHSKIFVARNQANSVEHVSDLICAAQAGKSDEVRSLLARTVPEYCPGMGSQPSAINPNFSQFPGINLPPMIVRPSEWRGQAD
ncbi:MAG: polysaccharide biosynthesis protein [Chloroflexi bacterium]|nr:polysaccharide biosynthesis protein [Chloroflexota bacterium]